MLGGRLDLAADFDVLPHNALNRQGDLDERRPALCHLNGSVGYGHMTHRRAVQVVRPGRKSRKVELPVLARCHREAFLRQVPVASRGKRANRT